MLSYVLKMGLSSKDLSPTAKAWNLFGFDFIWFRGNQSMRTRLSCSFLFYDSYPDDQIRAVEQLFLMINVEYIIQKSIENERAQMKPCGISFMIFERSRNVRRF